MGCALPTSRCSRRRVHLPISPTFSHILPHFLIRISHFHDLVNFAMLPQARTAQLEEAHVAALRIYTTGAFKVLNGPLRHPWGGSPHPFPVTVSFLSDAIGKLRAVGAIQPSALSEFDLWRGVKDRMTTADFAQRGGTEPAPMSTTSNLKVALKYTIDATARPHGGGHALLFKLRTDSFMGRGASLTWVSAFPGEEETVFPPLTYMKTSNKAAHEAVACADGLVVTVMEVNAYLGAA